VRASEFEVEVLPAESVSVTVTFQIPSESVDNEQLPEDKVHETLVDPAFVAVTIAVPAKVPETLISGVLSLVKLSVGELPRSEVDARSGVAGVAIVLALITRPVNADEAGESIPLTLWTAVTEYVPFASGVVKVQLPVVALAVNEQVTGEPVAGVAVSVISAPEVKDESSKVGVVSAVVLSEFDEPVSDAACKSGELEVGTVVVIAIIETDEEFAFPSSTITYAL
jgi:hypothetical protein